MANDNSGINGTWAATVPEPGTRALFSIARASFGLSRRITQRRARKGSIVVSVGAKHVGRGVRPRGDWFAMRVVRQCVPRNKPRTSSVPTTVAAKSSPYSAIRNKKTP